MAAEGGSILPGGRSRATEHQATCLGCSSQSFAKSRIPPALADQAGLFDPKADPDDVVLDFMESLAAGL